MQKYGELLRMLLEKRGIKDEAQAEVFLNPSYKRDLHDPFLMRDMNVACERILEAIKNNERIVIYADYDCDGIPGAVILHDLFTKLDYKNYEVYIPQRNSEGYGLNSEAIEIFSKSNAKLIITIDLGITAIDEVAQANGLGIDVIITDHHLPHKNLPKALAILNPKVDSYPEKMLCGAGVVFKLVQGLIQKIVPQGLVLDPLKARPFPTILDGWEKWMLDMAGLATLSDMVPLTGENRAISYFGMKVLRKSPRPGLIKLLAKMKVDQKYMSEDDVSFMITPKINVASRMGDPVKAYELLSAKDEAQAGAIVDYLLKINDERKTMVTGIMREVNKKLSVRETKEVIVIGNGEWRVGVLGLVAGKICDEYQKPVFVWGRDENDAIKGSCRSDGSVSVVELMTEATEHFSDFGGHELAGGFTVRNDKIHFLEDALSVVFLKICGKRQDLKEIQGLALKSDLTINLGQVNMKNWNEIEKMAPFGLANHKPIFLFENVKIEKIKKFGKNGSGEHLEIIFSDSLGKVKAISFFSTVDSFKRTISGGERVKLLASFDLSYFGGKKELRLRIIDII